MKTIKKAFAALGMAIAAVVPVVAAPGALAADSYYWPERGYTMESSKTLTTFPVLNSVKDNNGTEKAIGDERAFVRVMDTNGNLVKDMTLQAGKSYTVYVFFRNDANVNTEATIARDVKLSVAFPDFIAKGETGDLTGKITSSNAQPATITATAKLQAAENMALQYKVGSAGIYTSYRATQKVPVPDALFTSAGTFIGMDNNLDGRLAGGDGNSGNVVFELITTKADAPLTTPNTGPTEVMIGIACALALGGGGVALTITHKRANSLAKVAKGKK